MHTKKLDGEQQRMKRVIAVALLASSMGAAAETKLSCDLGETDRHNGEVVLTADVKVVVPEESMRKKNEREIDGQTYKTYEEWVINPQASLYRFRGKLDGKLVTLEKSMIQAGTGVVRGEIKHKEMGERPRKMSTYEGRCYLDQ
jgi:hypothetical protein